MDQSATVYGLKTLKVQGFKVSTPLFIALGAVVGAVLGSTASALAYRLPVGMNVAFARSECPSCHGKIAAYDNIPILSYLLLKGRCRSCHERISVSYIALESSMSLLYATLLPLYRFGYVQIEIYLAVFIAVTGAVVDLKIRRIPNKLTYVGLLGELVLVLGRSIRSHSLAPLEHALLALIIFGGFLFVVAIATKGMGLGDAKLMGVISLALSSFGLYFIFYVFLGSFALASVVGISLIVSGRASRKSAIPFGPFITLSFLLALFIPKL